MATYYYPPVGFHFKVKVSDNTFGEIDAGFQEASGISMEIKTEDVTEGGENGFVHRLPQSVQYSPLVLKRGLVVQGSKLDKWCRDTIQSNFMNIQRKDILVSLLSVEKHQPIMSWSFKKAYPTKFEISNFNASNNEIVVATLQFTYTKFELVHPSE
ncbi:phage tail protein [Rhodocytophaga rosea]|uniref:Phage tail protein n=1 Tax=Rhodocytophaga rosea TaxID=2704465 RepID=A0A6C0GDM8_9BACT|nr:phage tail protein [Rhodocytophaga rosea]QHT66027.1 phage tail protein [Rhodocytophaga rosea]